MNKFSKYFAAFASLAVLASCSNDEPTAPVNPTPEGTRTYIAVNIQDANSMSRAEVSDTLPTEGGYKYGEADEHTVKSANFFFFNEDGVYVTQAEVWNGGNLNNAPNTQNVEYLGKNVLVLKGITKEDTPKYMVTVLNAPTTLAQEMLPNVSTISDLRNKTYNYTERDNGETGDNMKDLMLLTTSTYNDDVKDSYYYGTTVLSADNLSTEPIDEKNWTNVTPVDVYVERLAAKYTFAGKTEFFLDLTVAGEGNGQLPVDPNKPDGTLRPVGATTVKVTITGLGITATADKSYLTKHPVTPQFETGTWETNWNDWNDPDKFRSYWGKSLYYDDDNTNGLKMEKVAMAIDNGLTKPVYSNENTKAYTTLQGTDPDKKVKANLVTNVVFAAQITSKDGKEDLSLVNYRGIFYKENHFMAVILKTLKERGELNFYKRVDLSSEVEGESDGTYKYVQVGASDLEIVRPKPEVKDAHMKLVFTDDETLYEKKTSDAGVNQYTEITNGKETLNGYIDDLLKSGGEYPIRYNGGITYYNIPVQHLKGTDNEYKVTGDGQYGIVRNHWYQFSVNKIMNIGNGVFDPNEDIVTPNENPDPETFGLAAKVNILSWKIVKQNIDL